MGPDHPGGFHIFISYRREDTGSDAGRLYDFLLRGTGDRPGFAEDQVFMDIDKIEPGDDFREVIAQAVAKCDVLLAFIGKKWTTVADAKGGRRLDNPGDYVRLEIEAALQRGIPVIPVLVNDAKLPSEAELPESIAELRYRNAAYLSYMRWDHEAPELLASLKRREKPKGDQAPARTTQPLPRTITRPGADAEQGADRTGLPSIVSIRRPKWTKFTPEGREEIKRRYDKFINKHREGDVLYARVGDITSDWADVYLAPSVAGFLSGKPVPRTGEERLLALRTDNDHVVTEYDVVRVRIEHIKTADTLAGWEIELSVVQPAPAPQDQGT